MVPEAGDRPWSGEHIRPYAEQAIRSFGKKRVMFGSDWPVCLLSAAYSQVWDLFASFVGTDWTEEEKNDIYGGNAVRFYGLTL